MIAFLFAYLGSTIFWMVYGILMIFVGTALLKRFEPETMEFIRSGNREYKVKNDDGIHTIGNGWVAFALITCYIFWPWVLIVIGIYYVFKFIRIIFKILFKQIFWSLFTGAIKFADKNIPDKESKNEKI